MKLFAGLLLGLLLSGCTSINTHQTESLTNGMIRTTKVSILSFFDSSAKVSKLRTTGTDKTQGVGIGEASTEASGSNVVNIIIQGGQIATKALIP